MQDIYDPIIKKISSWIIYEKNKPKTEYHKDKETHDRYRAENDLDCILCGGDLRADTIFSLWIPLRFSLVRLNGYEKIKNIMRMDLNKDACFLSELQKEECLCTLLPYDNKTVKLLSELFYYGQTRANVMLLPERWMQERGNKPYHDYMPYFLHECFEGGHFSVAFKSDDSVGQWIVEESFSLFFCGDINKRNIIDLAGTGDIKKVFQIIWIICFNII